jgi:DNA-binding Lrp family transcriptional regulator
VTHRLDAIDLAILAHLQTDGRMTNVELARRVGISAPPCLRRLRALEEAGIIKGYRALIDPATLGFSVSCFAFVQLAAQSDEALSAFETQAKGWSEVRECWTMSGDVDFILKCVASDLAAFQKFVARLTASPHVRNVRTALTLKTVKDEPAAPLPTPG